MSTDEGVLIPGGAKAVIHVHQQKIRKGEPAVIVRRRGKSRRFRQVIVDGPIEFVQTEQPDKCGARVTAVTHADVRAFEKDL